MAKRRKSLSEVQVYIIHIREREQARYEESVSFAVACGIDVSQVHSVNILNRELTEEELEQADAFIIGGAGAFSATMIHPFYPRIDQMLSYSINHDIPVFGSCWGHQYIGRFLGSRVVEDLSSSEYGCVNVNLTESGKQDPVFSRLPSPFTAYAGHVDKVLDQTENMIVLASNDKTEIQAFHIADKPVYATQFHPELTQAVLQERMLRYKNYLPFKNDKEFNKVYKAVPPEHDASTIMHQFMCEFVGDLDLIAG